MILLLFLAAFSVPRITHFSLPANARVTIGKAAADPEANDRDRFFCEKYKLTEKEVRVMFHTYHPISGTEADFDYLEESCKIEGTIEYRGQHFEWSARPGNTLRTNWNDGTWKQLGGKPTANTPDVR